MQKSKKIVSMAYLKPDLGEDLNKQENIDFCNAFSIKSKILWMNGGKFGSQWYFIVHDFLPDLNDASHFWVFGMIL